VLIEHDEQTKRAVDSVSLCDNGTLIVLWVAVKCVSVNVSVGDQCRSNPVTTYFDGALVGGSIRDMMDLPVYYTWRCRLLESATRHSIGHWLKVGGYTAHTVDSKCT
jgi:hypothetical protein